MTHSQMACMGSLLALLALVPLDCRQASSEKTTRPPEKNVDASSELRADEVTDVDKNTPPEKSAAPASASAPVRPAWEIAHEKEIERIQRETQARARADWHIAFRTDSATIVPCQPLYVTIRVTNKTDQPRKLRELLGDSKICMLAGRTGEQPRVVKKLSTERDVERTSLFDVYLETVIAGGGNVFFDRILTTERVAGEQYNNPTPNRIFNEPGEYKVYAAVINQFSHQGEILRSEPLVVTVREPTQSEAPYVEFLREGRQIPPHYGRSEVVAHAFEKLKDLPQPERTQRMVAFKRKVDAEMINKLRQMLAEHPDPPVADDMRHYLMVQLIQSARRRDEGGRDLGNDRDVLAAAAKVYLQIDPERKQLRRRSIKRWHGLTSHQYSLDEARPVFQILASWKASSPFYDDEIESQAALDKIMDEIEAPLADQARQRAAAPSPKPKPLPTD